MLICLDNAEDLLRNAHKKVKEFLDTLIWDGIPNLTVLITSRPLNIFLENVYTDSYEQYFSVDPLIPKEATCLFLSLSEVNISGEEIVKLIEDQQDYPY